MTKQNSIYKNAVHLFGSLVQHSLCSGSICSVVIYSEHTSSSLLSELSDSIHVHSDSTILFQKYSEALLSNLEAVPLNLVFDYTYSVFYSLKLKEYVSSRRLVYFSPLQTAVGKRVFLLHPSAQTEASALDRFIRYLNWKSFHILTSQKYDHKLKFRTLTQDTLYVISNTAHQEAYDDFTGKIVKPSGNWKSVVISDGQGVSKHIQSLENLRIYKERCAYITNSQGSWGLRKEGGLSVVEEGLDGAKSEGEYEFKAIKRVLDLTEKHLGHWKSSVLNNEVLLKHFEEIAENGVISSNYSIVNFRTEAYVAGTIYKNQVCLKEGEKILFPGNVTKFNESPPIIEMSANLGLVEPDGSQNLLNYFMNLAIIPMVKIINQDQNLLRNFELQIYSTDCGQTYFDYDFVSKCMKTHLPSLGAFYINTQYQEIGEGYIQVFREEGITIPHMAIFYRDWDYFDKELYPELFVTTAHLIYIHSILPFIFNSFRWEQILVFFLDTESQNSIDTFFHNAETLQIQILNDKDHMFIPWTLDKPKFIDKVLSISQYLYNTKCRIFTLLMQPPFNLWFLEALYDFGFRNGDIIAVNKSPAGSLIDYEEYYFHNKTKVIELIDGSLDLYNNEYFGEYGEELGKKISEMIAPEPIIYTCFQVDSLLLGVHTVDLMLQIGRDYEDPADINYFMRQERFTGCSGTVSIDSRGNGRNELTYTLYNFYVKDEHWKEDPVGYYTIGINVPLNISKDIVWPNRETFPPKYMRVEPQCGFSQDQVRDNNISRCLLRSISVFYILLVLFLGIFLWRKFFYFEYKELSEKKEMWFEDFVILVLPVLEALQYIALGPELGEVNIVLSYIASIFTLDLETLTDFKGQDFWVAMYIVISGVSLWIFCLFLFFTTCYKRLHKLFRGPIIVIGYRMVPVFSKAGFIIIISILLRLFKCKEGTGGLLTDSFLSNDCKTFCWIGLHLGISVYGFIVLLLYSLLAMLINSTSEYLMDYNNVKTSPLFSFLKSVFNLTLVLLNFHLKDEYPLAFSLIFLALFVVWTMFVAKITPYNYARLNFWQRLIGLVLCGYFLSMFIYETTGQGSKGIMIFQFSAILGSIILGIVIQYKFFPSMLYRRKGRNFDKLLRFAFRWDVSPKELTEHQLDYCYDQSEEYIEEKVRTFRTEGNISKQFSIRRRCSTIQ